MNETVQLIGATIVVIVCIGIVVYLFLTGAKRDAEAYREIQESKSKNLQESEKAANIVFVSHVLLGIPIFGTILAIAVPLALWTEIHIFTIDVIALGLLVAAYITRAVLEHRRELQKQPTYTISVKLFSVGEVLQSIFPSFILKFMMVVGFVVGVTFFHDGLSLSRFNYTVNQWRSSSGVIRENGDDLYYEYQVNGRNFIGTNTSFLKDVLSDGDYSVDEEVSVYYDPDNPEVSVLDTNEPRSPILNYFFSGLFFLVSLEFLVAFVIPTNQVIDISPSTDYVRIS